MSLKMGSTNLLTRSLPVLMWFAVLIAVGFLFVDQSKTVRLKGIAFSDEQVINSIETGYISSLPVKLYQTIKQGDTLAVIKENSVAKDEYVNQLLMANKTTAEAELDRLRAELVAAEERMLLEVVSIENDHFVIERNLALDLENARLNVLEIKTGLEPDKLTLKDLEVEIDIVKKLLQEDAAEEYELQKIQASYAILKEKVFQQEQLLAQAQNSYEFAQIRKDVYDQKYPLRPRLSEKELAPIRKAIIVQEKKIDELMTQSDVIVLKAPFDGIVSNLTFRVGQTVVRGEPIMTIVKPAPDVVTTWVSQSEMNQFQLHSKVEVISLDSPSQIFISHVSNMSASLEQIPQRLWNDPATPQWGRAIQIPIQPNFICLNNEIVGIRLLH